MKLGILFTIVQENIVNKIKQSDMCLKSELDLKGPRKKGKF